MLVPGILHVLLYTKTRLADLTFFVLFIICEYTLFCWCAKRRKTEEGFVKHDGLYFVTNLVKKVTS